MALWRPGPPRIVFSSSAQRKVKSLKLAVLVPFENY